MLRKGEGKWTNGWEWREKAKENLFVYSSMKIQWSSMCVRNLISVHCRGNLRHADQAWRKFKLVHRFLPTEKLFFMQCRFFFSYLSLFSYASAFLVPRKIIRSLFGPHWKQIFFPFFFVTFGTFFKFSGYNTCAYLMFKLLEKI